MNLVTKSRSEMPFQKCIGGSKTSNQTTITIPAPRTALPAVKFSHDTERLQKINNIRKSPVGAQIKLVIDLLFKSRQFFTAEQIYDACYVDIKRNKTVFDSLAKNSKVNYDGKFFSYKPTHSVKDQKELLELIRKLAFGIAVADLLDAYPTVMEDLQALKDKRQIWLLSRSDSKEQIAYPNDHNIHIKVDDGLKELFRSIELPKDLLDIHRDLQKNGMKPATNTASRTLMAQNGSIFRKPEQKKRKRKSRITENTKLTNSHLPPEILKIIKG